MQLRSRHALIFLVLASVGVAIAHCTLGPDVTAHDASRSANKASATRRAGPPTWARPSRERRAQAVAPLVGSPASDRWQRRIASANARERADGVDEIASAPTPGSEELVARLLAEDPDRYVRERAIFAYADLAGPRAAPLLKKVALEDADEVLGAAARANLDRLERENPEPPRGALTITSPPTFRVGEPFEVVVEFGSPVDVPKAQLEIGLPPGVELVLPSTGKFRGAIAAGETKSIVVRLRVTRAPLTARARLRLKLDYPGELEAEVLHQTLQVSAQGSAGALSNPTSTDE